MTIQYLSQLTALFDSLSFMWQFRNAESNLSPAALRNFRKSLDAVEQHIEDICAEAKVSTTRATKNFSDLDPSFGVPESLKGRSFNCIAVKNNDVELTDGLMTRLAPHQDLLKSEEKRILHLTDKMRDPKNPISSTVISTKIAEEVFKEDSELLPLEKVLLFQHVTDEVFSYGPLSPFLRSFSNLRMNEDGSYSAGNRILKIKFHDDQHKEETLAMLKYAGAVTTRNGTVEYESPGCWKIIVPAHLADEIDKPQTRLEKLGWTEGVIVVKNQQMSPVQKAVDWLTQKLAKNL